VAQGSYSAASLPQPVHLISIMGKKKVEPLGNLSEAASTEDSPAIKALKEIDDRYCKIQAEFVAEEAKLRQKIFNEKQAPLLADRAKALLDTTGVPADDLQYGTPACKGFWLQAFQNADVFAEVLEEHDEPVLEYLQDVKRTYTDTDGNIEKGFTLEFVFKENPFFSNSSLTMEVVTDFDPCKPYIDSHCVEMKSSAIEWKAGKNITVEMVAKKTKGGGAKKAKQKAKAPKEEPRESLFRMLFANIKQGEATPEDLKTLMGVEVDDDDEDIAKMLLERAYELGYTILEEIVPYAVRFYTGEAGDAESDSHDEEGESEEDDDDDDDDDDSDEDPAPKKKGPKGKPAAGKTVGDQKQEECKQQ